MHQSFVSTAPLGPGNGGAFNFSNLKKLKVGKDQEKAQSEKDSHSKNQGGKKTKLTIRYLYHENIS